MKSLKPQVSDTESSFPQLSKVQLGLLIGTPVALGLGYWYYKSRYPNTNDGTNPAVKTNPAPSMPTPPIVSPLIFSSFVQSLLGPPHRLQVF